MKTNRLISLHEVKVAYDKPNEAGFTKRTTETYVVDALSFAEAEGFILQEMRSMNPEIKGIKELKLLNYLKRASITYHYKVKVMISTINERNETEQLNAQTLLVGAEDFAEALELVDSYMSDGLYAFRIHTITETQIQGVYLNE